MFGRSRPRGSGAGPAPGPAVAAASAGAQRSERLLRRASAILRPAVLVLVALLAHRVAGQSLLSALANILTAAVTSTAVQQQRTTPKSTLKPNDPQLGIPCGCSDVDPRDSFLRAKVDYSCFDQARFGACGQSFMLETPEEVPEGYCQISCGRCSCCPTLDSVLRDKGLEMFRWLLGFSDEGAKIKLPGYMVTLLAPTDSAVWAALNRLGYKSKEDVERDSNAKNVLADIGRYHVLAPVEPLKATWTTPFMRSNIEMYTAVSNGKTVTARQDNGGKVTIQSPKSSANVVERDIYACKGYVQVLDAVLIPWSMTGYA
ncbi:hypothetical protein PLESTM_000523400 [Pleodorina starrii]|nr:hypothetical protein PLESTM_000523400 [Pleodorina starrii]